MTLTEDAGNRTLFANDNALDDPSFGPPNWADGPPDFGSRGGFGRPGGFGGRGGPGGFGGFGGGPGGFGPPDEGGLPVDFGGPVDFGPQLGDAGDVNGGN